MKKISTANITTAVGMPIKSGSLQHIQSAYQEALDALAKNALGSVDPTKVYVLWGCVDTGPGSTYYVISEGAVYYNGEIYYVPAVAISSGYAVANIDTSYFSAANADPVQFTDGISYNVHEIRQMVITDAAPGSGVADFDNFIRTDWITADVTSGADVLDGAGTINYCQIKYKRQGNTVFLNYNIQVTVSSFSGGIGSFLMSIPLPHEAVVNDEYDSPNAPMVARRHGTADFIGVAYIQEVLTTILKLEFFGTTTIDYLLRGQIIYQCV